MKILVDADACPVKEIIVSVAADYGVSAIMFADTCHMLDREAYEVVTVDKASDSVDIAIINRTVKGDIIVTQDYGLAALALAKHAYAINNNGLIYSNNNIDRLLFERHMTKKQIRSGNRTTAMRKRTREDDMRFEKSLRLLVERALGK